METILDKALGISLIIFMIGSLLEIGLKLRIDDAWRALRNVRFVILSLLWAFVLCPALAILLTTIIPLSKAYADGMLFLGMAPCAPFFPLARHFPPTPALPPATTGRPPPAVPAPAPGTR